MELQGYPFRPSVHEEANCGPTVLAALLGFGTRNACALMNHTYKKGHHGYTNIGHIRSALESKGKTMKKIKEYDELAYIDYIGDAPLLVFIQIDGPWVEKGWRSAYNHTHWALFHKGHVMDINNSFLGERQFAVPWVPAHKWHRIIMDHIVDGEGGTGWYVRSAYLVKDNG